MEQLRKLAHAAQRRLWWQQFLSCVTVCWFVALLAAAATLALPRIWATELAGPAWDWGWFAGAFLAGTIAAAVWAWVGRTDLLNAAVEVDRRFGLKERVSSSLALDAETLKTEAGQALVADATRRSGRVDLGEGFRISFQRRAWLPLLPFVASLALLLFIDAKTPAKPAPDPSPNPQAVAESTRVKDATETLRKKIEERQKLAKELGLEDSAELFKRIDEGIKEMRKQGDVDRKETLVKLNDLAKEIEQRRSQLGDRDQLRKDLDPLKNLTKGPADKLAQDLRNGNFQQALNDLEKMENQLQEGKLSEEQKEKLAEQLGQMKEKLNEMAKAQDQAQRDLEEQLQRERAEGNTQAAEKTQQQLERLSRKAQSQEQLQKMAEQLGQAAESLKRGNPADAKQALDQMAQSLERMEQQSQELQMLDGALDSIGECKLSMNGDKSGSGDKQGMGQGGSQSGQAQAQSGLQGGQGMGEGMGGPADNANGRAVGASGARPENENPTKLFDSTVKQNVGQGAAVATDLVEGPNVKGKALQLIKEESTASTRESSDPLANQRLSRQQRDQAQQYFDALREGK